MKYKITLILYSILSALFASAFIVTFVHSAYYAPEQEAEAVVVPPPQPKLIKSRPASIEIAASPSFQNVAAFPVRISIPALGINARVQQVGLTTSGRMANPNNFTDVGWYKHGTIPGSEGSAVIAGHVDNALGLYGVFARLEDIVPGSDIEITTDRKETLRFRVYNVQKYPYDKVPTDLIFNKHDDAYLNLITCAGSWVKDKKTYDERIVVFSKRIF